MQRLPEPSRNDRRIERAVNDISVALAAKSSGKWTPTPETLTLLRGLAEQLAERRRRLAEGGAS
jgi:hypothetical protein